MPALSITVTGTEALTRRLLELGEDAPKAATRAVNRTLSSLKTATTRALAENLGLRNKDVTPSIGLQRATVSRQFGALVVTGRRIPIMAFSARQTRRGVTYRLPGGRSLVPRAFIATMRSGHVGVFARRGPKRLPIVEQYGPSLPGAMVRSGILATQQDNANVLIGKNMAHEIDWIIRQRVQSGDE